MSDITQTVIGSYPYHREPNMNYQFNRIACLCGGNQSELSKVASRVNSIEDWTKEFTLLAEEAKREGRLREYSAYTRAVNFYLDSSDPRKAETYQEYKQTILEMNHREFSSNAIKVLQVPYCKGFLPVWHMRPKAAADGIQTAEAPKIVFHLGYDSLKEELLPVLTMFAEQGCEVWLFEGPGQGEALYRYGLPMTHEWEKPVGAVLDHLGLQGITLVGLSLGGYLAPRAAAYDKRIKHVVAWGVIYDFFGVVSTRRGKIFSLFLNFCMAVQAKFLLNTLVRKKMRADSYTDWGVSHGMVVMGQKDPWGYFKALKKYSLIRDSAKITQDFLLMGSSNDHFIPNCYFAKQVERLTNVRSLTARLFTDAEKAGDHVQFGNLPLAVRCITDWVKERSSSCSD